MRLHDIKPRPGAKHRIKRVGCGESSGHGKTSTRGHKGQHARSGGAIRPGFEGGQMPMHRRLPKKGFNNAMFRPNIAVVNICALNKVFSSGETVTELALRQKGILNHPCDGIKILGCGELEIQLVIKVDMISSAARAKVEKAGGSVSLLQK
jgi:large subunit ribosomal protein L15